MELLTKILARIARDLDRGHTASEIARDIKLNQKTVSNHLNRAEGQHLLTSTHQGKNKLFRLNPKTARKLLLKIEIEKSIDFLENTPMMSSFAERLKEKNILVFGSYAKGLQRKDSDLDIFVAGKHDRRAIEHEGKIWGLEVEVHSLGEGAFLKALENRRVLTSQIARDHVILNGFEFFVDAFLEKHYRDAFLYH